MSASKKDLDVDPDQKKDDTRKRGQTSDETASGAAKSKKFEPFCLNRFLATEQATTLKRFWQDNTVESLKNESVLLLKPFKLTVLQDFLDNPMLIDRLITEIESIEWSRRQMDLYEYFQSHDLACETGNSALKEFYEFFTVDVMPWMREVTGLQLTHISASCSMYTIGDHLLVHDDMLADRRIAFIFYLSPDKEKWTGEMGGALELFEADEEGQPMFPACGKVLPRNNQLVFFKVCPESFHQVAEVTTLEYPRITINGWFHETNFENKDSKLGSTPATHLPTKFTPNSNVDLSEWVSECYLKETIQQKIQQQIEAASEISLDQFLTPDVFEVMLNEFKCNTALCWKPMGPANLRRYDRLQLDDANIRGPVRDLVTLFTSRDMFNLLHAYTELDLGGANAQQPVCALEIQRWKAGCYTVLSDSSYDAVDNALDLVLYFNSVENVGKITYLSPETEDGEKSDVSDEEDAEPINLTIEPKDNVLNLVFRSEGTTKFTKYVSKMCQLKAGEYSYILVCSYKE